MRRNVKVHHIFPRAQLGVERHGRVIAMVRLHKDDIHPAPCAHRLQLLDQRCGDTAPAVPLINREVVDVELAAGLFKLGQHIASHAANDLYARPGHQGQEVSVGKQAIDVAIVRLFRRVGVPVLKGFAKECEHGTKHGGVAGGQRVEGGGHVPLWVAD